jgi:hypothetical protein
LAELEDADGKMEAAQQYYQAALEIIERIAGRLADADLRQQFLAAAPVNDVLRHARASALNCAGKER